MRLRSLAGMLLAATLLPPGGAAADDTTGVILRLADPPASRYRGGIGRLGATSVEPGHGQRFDARAAGVVAYRAYLAGKQDAVVAAARALAPGAQLLHRYDVALNGIALRVPRGAVDAIAALPGVVAVYPDEKRRLTTDRSPGFIGAPAAWKKLGGQGAAGEGVVVGILDSGVWPEHPSFADPDPAGKPYPAPPVSLACQFGIGANPGPPVGCNNKLIGAYRFLAGHDACVGAGQCILPAGAFTSARDDEGHGTHTASTAAGNGGVQATVLGLPRGTISGIAPRAWVIAYKVCGASGECLGSDSVAGVNQAILDGVDVLNFSIGGGYAPYSDPVQLAFLDAYAAGIFVAAAAGNEGPAAETVQNRGPWVTTVGASTQKRQFSSRLTLASSDGKKLKLSGATVTAGVEPKVPVLDAAAVGDPFCTVATPDATFAGTVAICRRGGNVSRLTKSFNVAQRGAVGAIIHDPFNAQLLTDNHVIPTVYLAADTSAALLAFLAAHPAVTATFPAGQAKGGKGDRMADFSSRGGPLQPLGVNKPDLTAPGLQILAGASPDSAEIADTDDELFQAIQGTSMSSPHVAGAAALVRALHPSFTPGQIKSTLMTLASAKKLVDQDGRTPSDPFDAGAGRLTLKQVAKVPITFDASASDYAVSGSALWNANGPSLYLPNLGFVTQIFRTARNVLAEAKTLKLKVEAPDDLLITVPESITVPPGGDLLFPIVVDVTHVPDLAVRHAAILFSGAGPKVRFPITVRRSINPVTLYGGNGGGATPVPGGVAILDQAVGTASVIGDPVTPGWLTGLVTISTSVLYGVTNEGGPSRLVRINPTNGALESAVAITDDPFFPSPVSIGDLAVNPGTDVFYGIRWNGDGAGLGGWLYRFGFDGFATPVGDTGSCTEGGLAFGPDPDRKLYFAGYTDCSHTSVALRTLDPATGATLTSIPLASGILYDGLAVRRTDGAIFASKGTGLYVIDPATGVEIRWGSSGTSAIADLTFR